VKEYPYFSTILVREKNRAKELLFFEINTILEIFNKCYLKEAINIPRILLNNKELQIGLVV